MAVTTYDKGIAKGMEQAAQRQREMVAAMLVKKFGVLPAHVRERLGELTIDELTDLGPRIIDATSLDDLQLV